MNHWIWGSGVAFLWAVQSVAGMGSLLNPVPAIEAVIRQDASDLGLDSWLMSADSAQRVAGVRFLGRVRTDASCLKLLTYLSDTSIEVQSEAAFALGQFTWSETFAPKCAAQIPSALEQAYQREITSTRGLVDFQFSSALLEAMAKWSFADPHAFLLAHMDVPAQLQKALVSGWMHTRYIRLFERMPNAPAPTLDTAGREFLERLILKDDANTDLVFYSMYHWRLRASDAVLKWALDQTNHREVLIQSLNQLTRHPDVNFKAKTMELLSHADARVRGEAWGAFLALKTDVTDTEIATALEREKDPTVLAPALDQVISSRATAVSNGSLVSFAQSTSAWVRTIAIRETIQLAPDDLGKIAIIENAFLDAAPRVREMAIQKAAKLDVALAQTFLTRGLNDVHAFVRGAALALLPQTGALTAAEVPLLNAALRDSSSYVRRNALKLLIARVSSDQDLIRVFDVYQASPELIWSGLRQLWVEQVDAKWTDSTGTLLLKRALGIESEPSAYNDILKRLQKRGVAGLPQSKIESIPLTASDLEWGPNARPIVRFETTRGSFELELNYDLAPLHAATFMKSVRSGFYDGMEFYRVEPGFVIQGGDQEGTGWQEGAFLLRAEMSNEPYLPGTLGMARSASFDSGSTHFFVTQVSTFALETAYTIFGRVVSGMDVVQGTELQDRVISAKIQ